VNVLLCSWGKRAAHNRAQIVYFLAENLEQRRTEFAQCLATLTGGTEEAGLREVDLSIKRLFHWAAYDDKYGGSVQVCLTVALIDRVPCPTLTTSRSAVPNGHYSEGPLF